MTGRYRILGLDLSLASTGYALPGGATGRIKSPASLAGYHRHDNVAARIVELVRANTPDLVVLEGYAPNSLGILSTIRSAELGGLIRTELARLRVDQVDISPGTLKKWATGKGNAKKPAMVKAAIARCARLTAPDADDEADAFLLRAMAIEALHLDDRSPLVDAIKWPLPRRPIA